MPSRSLPSFAPAAWLAARFGHASHLPMTDRRRLSPLHVALALLIVAVWGTNFVVIRAGLDELPPFLFAALRFAASARSRGGFSSISHCSVKAVRPMTISAPQAKL